MEKGKLATVSGTNKAIKKAKENKKRKEANEPPKDKVYKSHLDSPVYTYVLKDIVENIYKIGKTSNPHNRFKNLCVRGKVYPIALVKQDVEKILHTTYAENKMEHPDPKYEGNGSSEWFRPGGKFDEFIATVDKGKTLPYITPHVMVKDFLDNGILTIADHNTEWELNQTTYSYFMIGIEILAMLGYIKRSNGHTVTDDPENIFIIGQKVSMTEVVIDTIKEKYTAIVATDKNSFKLKEAKTDKSRLRHIDLKSKEFNSEVFLLLN
jgi:hypothetical protein